MTEPKSECCEYCGGEMKEYVYHHVMGEEDIEEGQEPEVFTACSKCHKPCKVRKEERDEKTR